MLSTVLNSETQRQQARLLVLRSWKSDKEVIHANTCMCVHSIDNIHIQWQKYIRYRSCIKARMSPLGVKFSNEKSFSCGTRKWKEKFISIIPLKCIGKLFHDTYFFHLEFKKKKSLEINTSASIFGKEVFIFFTLEFYFCQWFKQLNSMYSYYTSILTSRIDLTFQYILQHRC